VSARPHNAIDNSAWFLRNSSFQVPGGPINNDKRMRKKLPGCRGLSEEVFLRLGKQQVGSAPTVFRSIPPSIIQ
jgi:hypothetical protein